MKQYQEYNLTKVGNNYDEWMLYGDNDDEQGDLIATIRGHDHAFAIAELLNQMLEED